MQPTLNPESGDRITGWVWAEDGTQLECVTGTVLSVHPWNSFYVEEQIRFGPYWWHVKVPFRGKVTVCRVVEIHP